MQALWLLAFMLGYFSIGYHWGRFSWKAWHKKRRSVAGLLCFPVSYAKNAIGETHYEHGNFLYPIKDAPMGMVVCNTRELYAFGVGCFWPAKLLFNLPVLATLSIWHLSQATFNPGYFLSISKNEEMKQLLPVAKALPPNER